MFKEVTMSPFDILTMIGLVEILRLMCRVVMNTYWPVLSEFTISKGGAVRLAAGNL